jgi:hypothetical protein
MQHHLETVGDAHSEAQVIAKSVLASSSRASVQDLKKIGALRNNHQLTRIQLYNLEVGFRKDFLFYFIFKISHQFTNLQPNKKFQLQKEHFLKLFND